MEKVIALNIGSYLRSCFGERLIGDAIITHEVDEFSYFVVIDGIGHGPTAESISSEIVTYLQSNWIPNPSQLIENVHSHMLGSAGAVIGISLVNLKKSTLTFAGLGNISCKILSDKNTQMVSADGLLGSRYRSVSNSEIKIKRDDLIVMHSDGVSSTAQISEMPKLRALSPKVLAKLIVQDYGSEFDDASCLVVKCSLV